MTSMLPSSLTSPVAIPSATKQFDVTVIGGGIAGLAFTLRLPQHLTIALLTKGALGESNTRYAQGGLAAAIGPQDNPQLHFEDTISSGAGLCDEAAVRTLVEGGPEAVAWLLAQGTHFDIEGNEIALGLEAAHSRNRVLHAGGDATGAEIERSLVQQIRNRPHITLFENATAIDMVRAGGGNDSIAGSVILLDGETQPTFFESGLTVLANGGAGQVWAVSSNPAGATGDGIAMTLRAGVDVADLEFTQFHPTVFSTPGAEPFLMTEAIRGEGGYLRSADGTRFMLDQHPLAELAPRDVVARAVQSQMLKDDSDVVYLDLSHLDSVTVHRRFPTIAKHLAQYEIDIATDLIPVAPAAHYFIGGIVAASDGTTSVPGLLAIGEVSCTGVHGANRLASNSLLEGLVFGLHAADRIAETGLPSRTHAERSDSPAEVERVAVSTPGTRKADLQRIMSDLVAVVRSRETLLNARAQLTTIAESPTDTANRDSIELRNMILLANEIVESALFREESRGAHFRSDFPDTNPGLVGMHQTVRLHDGITLRRFSSLSATVLVHVAN